MGSNKGYKYEHPSPRAMWLMGNEQPSGWKYSEESRERLRVAKGKLDHKEILKKSWANRPRTYVIVYPDGSKSRTTNMRKFCENKPGLCATALCRVARRNAGILVAGTRLYKGIDCYKVGTLVNNKRKPIWT